MTVTACPAACGCHSGPFAACTVPGGCGSEGCGRQARTSGSCPSCWRRDPDPSTGDGRVCGPCERWLPIALSSVAEKTAALPELIVPTDLPVDDRWYWHCFPRRKGQDTGDLLPPEGEWRRADPVSVVGGAGPTSGRRGQPRVSGGREGAPVPLRLGVLDLLGPVVRDGGRPVDAVADWWLPRVVPFGEKVPMVGKDGQVIGYRQPTRKVWSPPGDQIGHVPVAQVLDQEVRAWIDAGAPGSRWRPVPTVPVLVDWLVKRLPWAREHYEPIGEFRTTIDRLRGVLMATLDEFDPPPELCVGVECNRCDQRLLYRRHDGTGDVECAGPDCRSVMRAADYREWVKWQGAYQVSRRSPQEVADLLRPTYRPDTSV